MLIIMSNSVCPNIGLRLSCLKIGLLMDVRLYIVYIQPAEFFKLKSKWPRVQSKRMQNDTPGFFVISQLLKFRLFLVDFLGYCNVFGIALKPRHNSNWFIRFLGNRYHCFWTYRNFYENTLDAHWPWLRAHAWLQISPIEALI